jgi:Tfp pilus assembly protein PilF
LAILAILGGALALIGGLAPKVGRLPASLYSPPGLERRDRELDSAVRKELSGLLRGAYRDGAVTAEERDVINRAMSAHRLIASDVDQFESELRPHVIAASHLLSAAKQDIEARRLGSAVKKYQEATEIDPEDAIAWAGLAAALTLNGEAQSSEFAYKRALTLDPGNWLANYNLGLAAARRGDSEVASQYFRRALDSIRSGGPEHRAILAALKRDPELNAFRSDPRFAALLDKSSK